jgi:hypothetical protein
MEPEDSLLLAKESVTAPIVNQTNSVQILLLHSFKTNINIVTLLSDYTPALDW